VSLGLGVDTVNSLQHGISVVFIGGSASVPWGINCAALAQNIFYPQFFLKKSHLFYLLRFFTFFFL
jgi:hypothetical protein